MKVELIKISIDKLKPTAKNPRKISKSELQQLEKSIKEFPEMLDIRYIVVDENFKVLGGHQRLKALKNVGQREIVVQQVSGLTEKQKDQFIIKDNVANGDWDYDVLETDWDVDDLIDWGIFDLKKNINDEKDIKNDPPKIVTSYMTFDYCDSVTIDIKEETAIALMEEMLKYKDEHKSFKGFWDERLCQTK